MQPFSGYLSPQTSSLPLHLLSPEGKRKIIREYADAYNLPESYVEQHFDEIAAQSKSKDNPRGIIPTAENLRGDDVYADHSRRTTKADVALAPFDQAMMNIGGQGHVIPYAALAAKPTWALMSPVYDSAHGLINTGYNKSVGGEMNPLVETLLPMAVFSKMDPLVQRGVHVAANKLPYGHIATNPWKAATHIIKPTSAVGKFIGRGGLGTAVDIGTTLANTGYDWYENAADKKARRYTDQVRDAIGYHATPWQAAAAYQGKRGVDRSLDHAKTTALVLMTAAGIPTGGMISMLGGARAHTETLPGFGVYDPLLMGKTNRDLILKSVRPGLEGATARRKIKYRNRDGFFRSGLGKWLSGEYFNHEHDLVDRAIAQERKDFRTMADYRTLAKNPKLGLQILKAKSDSAYQKSLLRKRYKWLKDTGEYDKAAKQVGADTSTLA